MPPMLEARGVRIDVSGVPAVDGLTLASTGEHVLVLGAARALFEAAAGLRAARRGELRVEGAAPLDAVRSGRVAAASLDPPMPPGWTVRQYATWSARLAGASRGDARALADEALARLLISSLAGAKLGRAAASVRRATVIAAALATGATTLLVEDPFAGLPDEVATTFARTVARALGDRRTAFFAGRVPLASPVVLAADEALIIEGAQVAAQGAPAELAGRERTVALRVAGDVGAFADAVSAQGGRLLAPPATPGPSRVTVDLGVLGSRDLLRIAAASGAVVLELRPIARAFC